MNQGSVSEAHRGEPELVSVIIPVRNGARTLGEQLAALAGQTYAGAWELLVVDNGSSDDTVAVAESWMDRLPLRVIDSSQAVGVAHARNHGIDEARGELVCICDADDIVMPRWMEELVAAALHADLVAGALDVDVLTPPHARSWRPRPAASLGTAPDYAPGGNCAVWREVAKEVGGFEETGYGEDTLFSAKVLAAGFTLGWAPEAVVQYRLPSNLRDLYRKGVQQGRGQTRLDRRSNDRWSRKIWSDLAPQLIWLLVRLPYLLTQRRGIWIRRAALFMGNIGEWVKPSPAIEAEPTPR